MPTYVYECRSCGKSFEVEQRITEAPLTDCECGGNIRRIIQPVGISFKGSGFYVNDSKAAPPTPKADATPAVDAPKTEAAPAETKTEAPAPTPATPAPKVD